jgi:hypothetical protein
MDRNKELRELVISLQDALDRYKILHVQHQEWSSDVDPKDKDKNTSDHKDPKETHMIVFELRKGPRNLGRSKSFLASHLRAKVEHEQFHGTIMEAFFPRWYQNWHWRESADGQRVESIQKWHGKQGILQVRDGVLRFGIRSLFEVHLSDDEIRRAILFRQKSKVEWLPYKCPNWICTCSYLNFWPDKPCGKCRVSHDESKATRLEKETWRCECKARAPDSQAWCPSRQCGRLRASTSLLCIRCSDYAGNDVCISCERTPEEIIADQVDVTNAWEYHKKRADYFVAYGMRPEECVSSGWITYEEWLDAALL